MSAKAVMWMECVFVMETVIMNLYSLEKKINLKRLIQKSIKNWPIQLLHGSGKICLDHIIYLK